MHLYEYQGKYLFSKIGIRIPESVLVDKETKLSKVDVGKFPVIAKVQALAPGRGEYGGVKKCNNSQDLAMFINTHLNNTFRGEVINKILVENFIDYSKEYYFGLKINSLSLTLDVIFSEVGGNGIEQKAKSNTDLIKIIRLDPTKPLYDYETNNIAKSFGFSGKAMLEVSNLISKMFALLKKFDAKLVEINPVVISQDNKVYALDAIVQLDDDANFRQSLGDHIGVISEERPRETTPREKAAMQIDLEDYRGAVHYIDLDEHGDIGLMSVGSGFSITVLDILKNFDISPANFCDCSGNPSKEKVAKAAKLIMQIPGIKAFLFISGMVSQPLSTSAEGLVSAFQEINPEIPIFVRMAGNQENEAVEILKKNCINQAYTRKVSVEDVILKVKENLISTQSLL